MASVCVFDCVECGGYLFRPQHPDVRENCAGAELTLTYNSDLANYINFAVDTTSAMQNFSGQQVYFPFQTMDVSHTSCIVLVVDLSHACCVCSQLRSIDGPIVLKEIVAYNITGITLNVYSETGVVDMDTVIASGVVVETSGNIFAAEVLSSKYVSVLFG